MAARARRKNARRTWPDGSGCQQRPLHPHTRGCIGWDWSGPRTRPTIHRCDDCAIFDDNEEAAEHVSACAACQAVLWPDAGPMAGSTDDEPIPMPSLAKRRKWSSWANTVGRQSRYSGAPTLDPDSGWEAIIDWLVWNDPNGDYAPDVTTPQEAADALANAWGTLGELAESDED